MVRLTSGANQSCLRHCEDIVEASNLLMIHLALPAPRRLCGPNDRMQATPNLVEQGSECHASKSSTNAAEEACAH